MSPKDFKVGDTVKHMSGSIGEVKKVTDAVHVAFNPRTVAIYDDLWFRVYPDGLKIVSADTGSVT